MSDRELTATFTASSSLILLRLELGPRSLGTLLATAYLDKSLDWRASTVPYSPSISFANFDEFVIQADEVFSSVADPLESVLWAQAVAARFASVQDYIETDLTYKQAPASSKRTLLASFNGALL